MALKIRYKYRGNRKCINRGWQNVLSVVEHSSKILYQRPAVSLRGYFAATEQQVVAAQADTPFLGNLLMVNEMNEEQIQQQYLYNILVLVRTCTSIYGEG